MTGSRASGPWPPPPMVTNEPPVTSARAAPAAWGRMASSSPWMTSTGQRTRSHTDRKVSSPQASSPRSVSISVAASISSPHPTQSSICFVECGSVNIRPKKNSRKSWYSRRQ